MASSAFFTNFEEITTVALLARQQAMAQVAAKFGYVAQGARVGADYLYHRTSSSITDFLVQHHNWFRTDAAADVKRNCICCCRHRSKSVHHSQKAAVGDAVGFGHGVNLIVVDVDPLQASAYRPLGIQVQVPADVIKIQPR